MQIAKCGNSLALRIPAEIVRQFGLREGDTVKLCSVIQVPCEQADTAALLALARDYSGATKRPD